MKTKKLTLMALLTGIALVIFVAESRIPAPVPIPGVKLGLANIITLVAMALLGKREAGLVLTARIILGSVFAGSVSAMIFSLCGGAAAYGVMCLLADRFPPRLLWVVSVFAALAHNAGQLAAAAVITMTPGVLYYGFALAVSAIITGSFTGLAAMYMIKRLPGDWKLSGKS